MSDEPIEGLAQLLVTVEELRDLVPARAALRAGALMLRGALAAYPPASRRPQPLRTDRQRRGFFYRLHHGLIDVPYRRGSSPGSETLGRRWTIGEEDDGRRQVIGNNARYGRPVQDADYQTAYHRDTGWPTVQGVEESEGPKVFDLVKAYVDEHLAGG